MLEEIQVNRDKLLNNIIIFILIPIISLLIVFPSVLQPAPVLISEYHDAMALSMPDFFLSQHPLSLWNNQWITGIPEIASPNSDRFYLFSFPIFFIINDISAINWILLVNLFIAYLAFYKLGSLLVKKSDLLVITSVGYMLSGVLLSRVYVGHIQFVYNMAWIPLIYFFFLKIILCPEKNVFNIIGLSISSALLFFSGGIYYFVFTGMILCVFFICSFFQKKISRPVFLSLLASFLLLISVISIKMIPNLLITPFIRRIDFINPLGDGGSLENNLASFIFGTPIDTVFGSYETMALIGIIPLCFAIIALIWGRKDITIPSFFSIIFAFLWADGGKTVLSFIHLVPILDNFRNAGRIFGVIMPILLLLCLYGIHITNNKIKNRESFSITKEQKNSIKFGVIILILLKILELPYQENISLEAILALVLIFGFIGLCYFDLLTKKSLLFFFLITLVIDASIICKNFDILKDGVIIKSLILGGILLAALVYFNKNTLKRSTISNHVFSILLIIGIFISILGNISVLSVSDPQLNQCPVLKIIDSMKGYPQNDAQIWVFDYGWPVKHIDFTYWLIKNGIHPMMGYYSYLPKNTPPVALNIGNTTYYTPNYIVDAAYLENGNQNIPNATYKINNISIFRPDKVLPNAFVIRNEQPISTTIEKFSPDEIILNGQFFAGDIAVLKSAYFPGWKINGVDGKNAGNMVGAELTKESSQIIFRYDPLDFKVGVFLTALGFLIILVLFWKRKEFGEYLNKNNREITLKKNKKPSKKNK